MGFLPGAPLQFLIKLRAISELRLIRKTTRWLDRETKLALTDPVKHRKKLLELRGRHLQRLREINHILED